MIALLGSGTPTLGDLLARVGRSAARFSDPNGLAVDASGNVYVADTANSRVLRFLAPFSNVTRVEPDAVYGQLSFTSGTAGVAKNALNRPQSVAFDAGGAPVRVGVMVVVLAVSGATYLALARLLRVAEAQQVMTTALGFLPGQRRR